MGKEIKIEFSAVHSAIADVRSASQAVKTDLPNGDIGRNQLESLNELLTLVKSLNDAVVNYQTLLADQLNKTDSLIDSVKKTDETAAGYTRLGGMV
jgi:trans-aconitate methyltransferase